ncbi:hypothetical protein [Flavobacterium sp. UBA4197]|uniref:hypothetical protein n=1 Tax=Flavobacterium sp. UBA4197 TaxID=1946546 RepID=UPI00257A5E0F|nr:hypothetical protein [Flavobacterium sp. UBA4197]
MKIIAVNISKTIHNIEPQEATKRAWKLNIKRANNYRFVIGVNKGEIHHFELLNVFKDKTHEDRVAFDLKECSNKTKADIDKYIENVNLKYITTKYIK